MFRHLAAQISAAVKAQLWHGQYSPSGLYGDGAVSERIAAALVRLHPYLQKRLDYVREDLPVAVGAD